MSLKDDPELKKLVEKHGELEVKKSGEPFRRLIVSIINQQLSTESAEAIRERFFDRFEITPEKILEADPEEMNELGVSSQKIDYMKSSAEKFIQDGLSREKFSEMSDEEVIDKLTGIHGVGDWTAKMFLIFVLGRKDIFPVEDLGIRQAMEDIYGIESRKLMKEKSLDWKPERSLASLYLWEHSD